MTDVDAQAEVSTEEPRDLPDVWHIKCELVRAVSEAGQEGLTLQGALERVRASLGQSVVDLEPYVDSLCRIGVLEFGDAPDTRRLRATDKAGFFIEGARTFA